MPGQAGAVERGEELGAARAHDAGEADDLARVDVEGNVHAAPASRRARGAVGSGRCSSRSTRPAERGAAAG